MRGIAAAMTTALARDVVHVALLAEFEFAGGTVNIWAGPDGHALTYDGKTWQGVGELGQIDKLAEGQGLTDSRITVSLRIDSENITLTDVEDSRGNVATIILLLLDDAGAVIGPIEFRTTMGAVRVLASVSTDEQGRREVVERLELELLSETAQLNQTHIVRMTYAAGRLISSTDHGLEFVADPEAGNLGGNLRAWPPGDRPMPNR